MHLNLPHPCSAALVLLALTACDTPRTEVLFENAFGPDLMVYRARWHSVALAEPLAPGAVAAPLPCVPASPTPAWVLLAPGWSPEQAGPPSRLVVLRSREPLELHLDHTLQVLIDDAHFDGRCGAARALDQADADFATARLFTDEFAGRSYDAATCMLAPGAAP